MHNSSGWARIIFSALIFSTLPAAAQLTVPACFNADGQFCTDDQLPMLEGAKLQAVLDGTNTRLFDEYVAARQLERSEDLSDICIAFALYRDLSSNRFADASARKTMLGRRLGNRCSSVTSPGSPVGGTTSGGSGGIGGGGGGATSGGLPDPGPIDPPIGGSGDNPLSSRPWDDRTPLPAPSVFAPAGQSCPTSLVDLQRNIPLAELASALAYAVYDDPRNIAASIDRQLGLEKLKLDAMAYELPPGGSLIDATEIHVALPFHLEKEIEIEKANLKLLQATARYRTLFFQHYGLQAALVSTKLYPNESSSFYAEAIPFQDRAVLIVYRGTDDGFDWLTNLSQFLSAGSKVVEWITATPDQYQLAVRFAEAVKKAYPGRRIYAIGHSLGGGLAAYATLRAKLDGAYTFNSAQLGASALKRLGLPASRAGASERHIFNFISLHPGIGPDLVSSASRVVNAIAPAAWEVGSRLAGYQVYVPIRIPNPFPHNNLDELSDAIGEIQQAFWEFGKRLAESGVRKGFKPGVLNWAGKQGVKHGLHRNFLNGQWLTDRTNLQKKADEYIWDDGSFVVDAAKKAEEFRRHPIITVALAGEEWAIKKGAANLAANVAYNELSIHAASGISDSLLPFVNGSASGWHCLTRPPKLAMSDSEGARLSLGCRTAGHAHTVWLRYYKPFFAGEDPGHGTGESEPPATPSEQCRALYDTYQ